MKLAYVQAYQGESEVDGNDSSITLWAQDNAVGNAALNTVESDKKDRTKDWNSATDPGTWSNSFLGKAEATQAVKQGLLDAANMQHNAVLSYQADAKLDETNAENDVKRAQELLEALVLEIAPVAREETEERVALAAALALQEAAAKDVEELGEEKDGDNAATGAYEILN